MWLTEGCGGRRRAVATPNRESRKEKKKVGYILDHVKCERLQEVLCRPRQPSHPKIECRLQL